MNTARLPTNNPKIDTESEIIFSPTVSHQTKKKGLSMLNNMPPRIGLLLNAYLTLSSKALLTSTLSLIVRRILRICRTEKKMIVTPPSSPMNLRTWELTRLIVER